MASFSGWLTKEGAWVKSWKRRFFVLDSSDATLSYFENPPEVSPGEKPKGIIPLVEYRTVTRSGAFVKNKRNMFTIAGDPGSAKPPREYYLVAESSEARERWIRALQATPISLELIEEDVVDELAEADAANVAAAAAAGAAGDGEEARDGPEEGSSVAGPSVPAASPGKPRGAIIPRSVIVSTFVAGNALVLNIARSRKFERRFVRLKWEDGTLYIFKSKATSHATDSALAALLLRTHTLVTKPVLAPESLAQVGEVTPFALIPRRTQVGGWAISVGSVEMRNQWLACLRDLMPSGALAKIDAASVASVAQVYVPPKIHINSNDSKLLKFVTKAGNEEKALSALAIVKSENTNVNSVVNKKGETALVAAASKPGNANMIRVLIENGCGVNVVSADHRSPLHAAADACDTESVNLLINKGAVLNVLDNSNRTPLQIAQDLERGPTLAPGKVLTPKQQAQMRAAGAVVRAIQKYQSDITKPFAARDAANLDSAMTLITNGVDPDFSDSDGNSLLHHAASAENNALIKALIQRHATVNRLNLQSETPLHSAVQFGNRDAVQDLFVAGADLNARNRRGQTPVHIVVTKACDASEAGDSGKEAAYLAILTFLLEKGAHPNSLDAHFNSPLHVAADAGHAQSAAVLLQYGANSDLRNSAHETPFELAKRLRNAVFPVIKNWEDSMFLLEAARTGDVAKVDELLTRNEAIINTQGFSGETALHVAVRASELHVVQRLLAIPECSTRTRDRDGRTALDVAQELGATEILSFLRAQQQSGSFLTSARNGNVDALRDVVANDPSKCIVVDADGDSALIIAIKEGHIGCTEFLATCPDLRQLLELANNTGLRPLHVAVKAMKVDHVEKLLQAGADINAYTQRASYDTVFHVLVNEVCSNAMHSLRDVSAVTLALTKTAAGDLSITNAIQQTPLDLLEALGGVRASEERAILFDLLITHKAVLDCFEACRLNDPEALTTLMANIDAKLTAAHQRDAFSYNTKNADGMTMLHVAATQGRLCIRPLLTLGDAIDKFAKYQDPESGATLTASDLAARNGWSSEAAALAVHEDTDKELKVFLEDYCAKGKRAQAEAVLDEGLDVNQADANGRTGLHFATLAKARDTVAMLLDRGADPSLRDNDGNNALHLAVKRKDTTVRLTPHDKTVMLEVVTLLFRGARVDAQAKNMDGATPAKLCADASVAEGLNALILGQKVLDYAAAGELGAVRDALAQGANVTAIQDSDGNTALHCAVRAGHVDVAKELIKANLSTERKNKMGETPYDIAVRQDDYKMQAFMEDKGAVTVLIQACMDGEVDRALELVAETADLDAWTRSHRRALHFAAFFGLITVVDELLAYGASVNVQDEDGLSPLSMAVMRGHVDVIKALLDADADVNLLDYKGCAPLLFGAVAMEFEAIKAVLESGRVSNVNVCDPVGKYVLHYAVTSGRTDIMRLLLEVDTIEVDVVDAQGRTPLMLAVLKGLTEQVRMLVAAGADIHGVASLGGMYRLKTCPLLAAVEAANVPVLNALFELGARINDLVGHVAWLVLATGSGQYSDAIVRVLVTNGANAELGFAVALNNKSYVMGLACGIAYWGESIYRATCSGDDGGVRSAIQDALEFCRLWQSMGAEAVRDRVRSRNDSEIGAMAKRMNPTLEFKRIKAQAPRELKPMLSEDLPDTMMQAILTYQDRESGDLALHVAARRGYLAITQRLLFFNPVKSLDMANKEGLRPEDVAEQEPEGLALFAKHRQVIRFNELVVAGDVDNLKAAFPDAEELLRVAHTVLFDGYSCVHRAIRAHQDAMAEFLLSNVIEAPDTLQAQLGRAELPTARSHVASVPLSQFGPEHRFGASGNVLDAQTAAYLTTALLDVVVETNVDRRYELVQSLLSRGADPTIRNVLDVDANLGAQWARGGEALRLALSAHRLECEEDELSDDDILPKLYSSSGDDEFEYDYAYYSDEYGLGTTRRGGSSSGSGSGGAGGSGWRHSSGAPTPGAPQAPYPGAPPPTFDGLPPLPSQYGPGGSDVPGPVVGGSGGPKRSRVGASGRTRRSKQKRRDAAYKRWQRARIGNAIKGVASSKAKAKAKAKARRKEKREEARAQAQSQLNKYVEESAYVRGRSTANGSGKEGDMMKMLEQDRGPSDGAGRDGAGSSSARGDSGSGGEVMYKYVGAVEEDMLRKQDRAKLDALYALSVDDR